MRNSVRRSLDLPRPSGIIGVFSSFDSRFGVNVPRFRGTRARSASKGPCVMANEDGAGKDLHQGDLATLRRACGPASSRHSARARNASRPWHTAVTISFVRRRPTAGWFTLARVSRDVLGYEVGELLGATILFLVHPEDAAVVRGNSSGRSTRSARAASSTGCGTGRRPGAGSKALAGRTTRAMAPFTVSPSAAISRNTSGRRRPSNRPNALLALLPRARTDAIFVKDL